MFTDYPVVEESLEHPKFELVERFSDSTILFVRHPVSSFYDLGLRMINQFPHQETLLGRRAALQVIRSKSRAQKENSKYGKEDASDNETGPSWYPMTFDLATEVNQFLKVHKKLQDSGQDNHWLVKPAGVGMCYSLKVGLTVPKMCGFTSC